MTHHHTIAGRGGIDIVDAQIHLMREPDLDGTLAAMDALGIRTIIVDEYWSTGPDNRVHPSLPLPDGAFRPIPVRALEAVLKYPDRFAFLQRISRQDPDAPQVIETIRRVPGGVGIRIILGGRDERIQFQNGGWDHVIARAAETDLPVNLLTRGMAALATVAVSRHPKLRLVLDHCGWCSSPDEWPAVLALADHPNVYLKWSHPDRTFGDADGGGQRKRAGLIEAIGAFGAERIMWASDVTHEETAQSWFELLAAVHQHPDLSTADRAMILGQTARRLYGLGH